MMHKSFLQFSEEVNRHKTLKIAEKAFGLMYEEGINPTQFVEWYGKKGYLLNQEELTEGLLGKGFQMVKGAFGKGNLPEAKHRIGYANFTDDGKLTWTNNKNGKLNSIPIRNAYELGNTKYRFEVEYNGEVIHVDAKLDPRSVARLESKINVNKLKSPMQKAREAGDQYDAQQAGQPPGRSIKDRVGGAMRSAGGAVAGAWNKADMFTRRASSGYKQDAVTDAINTLSALPDWMWSGKYAPDPTNPNSVNKWNDLGTYLNSFINKLQQARSKRHWSTDPTKGRKPSRDIDVLAKENVEFTRLFENMFKSGIDPVKFLDWYKNEYYGSDLDLNEGFWGAVGQGLGSKFRGGSFMQGWQGHWDQSMADSISKAIGALKRLKLEPGDGRDIYNKLKNQVDYIEKMLSDKQRSMFSQGEEEAEGGEPEEAPTSAPTSIPSGPEAKADPAAEKAVKEEEAYKFLDNKNIVPAGEGTKHKAEIDRIANSIGGQDPQANYLEAQKKYVAQKMGEIMSRGVSAEKAFEAVNKVMETDKDPVIMSDEEEAAYRQWDWGVPNGDVIQEMLYLAGITKLHG